MVRENKLAEHKKNSFDSSLSGAHILNPTKINLGYNLYDGKLIDEEGKLIKEWPYKYLGLIQNDGSYIAQKHYESKEWGKFTRDCKQIWISEVPIHHDIIITPKGNIMTLTKEMHRYRGRNVDFCVIVEFNQDGKELWRWSSWTNLKKLKKLHKSLELDMPKLLFFDIVKKKPITLWGGNYDYYRFNSLQIIPENNLNDKRFQEGNILVSARHGSIIFILDKDSKDIVWLISQNDVKDNIEGQHSVQMLKNGRLLIFDNGRYRGWSRVIELDPINMDILWEYKSDNFFTLSQGYAQRLANGNTLITESEKGHVFEVGREGEKVWEYYHPEIQNKDNSPDHPESWGSRQWIYRMLRYQKEFIENFQQKK